MFGRHRLEREQRNLKKNRRALQSERAVYDQQKQSDSLPSRDNDLDERVRKNQEYRQQAQKEGRLRSDELLNRDVEGLPSKKRAAMQYEANQQIHRDMQSANRKLLGEQGKRGIKGNSGVAYAQQRDLQKLANEAQGQATRDLDRLDSDLALKKLAAGFNVEQGEAAQALLDRQLALDEMRYEDERKRQRGYEDRFNRQFSRI